MNEPEVDEKVRKLHADGALSDGERAEIERALKAQKHAKKQRAWVPVIVVLALIGGIVKFWSMQEREERYRSMIESQERSRQKMQRLPQSAFAPRQLHRVPDTRSPAAFAQGRDAEFFRNWGRAPDTRSPAAFPQAKDDGVKGKDAKAAAVRPSAERVARRALVLSLVMYRASLEQFPGQAQYETLHSRLPAWVDRLGLAAELEKEEHDFLRVPLGKADERVARNAAWRHEGLGVLAWALKQFELPRYDEDTDPRKAAAAVGFSEDLLSAMDTWPAEKLLRDAQLRPPSETDRFARHSTIVNWRLRDFRLKPRPIEFADTLRAHPSFKETWLEGLRLTKGDLAIGDRPIGVAPSESVQHCEDIAVERQRAARWLQGDDPVYSKVDISTILTGLR